MPLSRILSPFTLKGATSGTTKFLVTDAVSPNITFPAVTSTLATLGTNAFVGNQSVTGNTTITGTLSASGSVTKPGQPAFLATNGSAINDVTGDGTFYTVIFNTEVFDIASNYTQASGLFTAPVTGKYTFSASVQLSGLLSTHEEYLMKVSTSNRDYTVYDVLTTNAGPWTTRTMQVSVAFADMDVGDTASVVIYVASGTKVVDVAGDVAACYFSGGLTC